jgi:hypothetical protein
MTFIEQTDSMKLWNLSSIMRKKFSIKLAINIKQYLRINPIAPNKIGISFTKDIKLSSEQKEILRECLFSAYGSHIEIVTSSTKAKARARQKTIVQFQTSTPETSETPDSSTIERIKIEDNTKDLVLWQKTKRHLISVYGEDAVRALFSKLEIREEGNKITFTGSDTFTDMSEQKFGANLSWLAKEHLMCFVFIGEIRSSKELVVKRIGEENVE